MSIMLKLWIIIKGVSVLYAFIFIDYSYIIAGKYCF